MITKYDDRNGVTRSHWKNVRDRVAKVEPHFARLVDQLDPDESFALYLVYLPYGALKGDTQSTFFPDGIGGYYRLSDPKAPKKLINDLHYGVDGSPMGMVLEKQFEYFIDLKHKDITIPWLIYSPGQFFPISTILGCKSADTYAPNGLLTVTSGARSTFMLPNIGCNTHHINLKRDYNITVQAPKSLYDHWHLFKEIANNDIFQGKWRSCLIYFSEKWMAMLHNDPAWMSLKLYMHEVAWRRFEYERNRVFYEIAFSLIQEKRNLKPNPYLTDTARHLYATALGAVPGYIPAMNDQAVPVDIIQKVFLESYGLKKYIPTIMQPEHFTFERHQSPIYYSLQHPSTHVFSPKSRVLSSTLTEMLELEHIMHIFSEELSSKNTVCSDTILGKVAENVSFKYFHNKAGNQRVIRASSVMPDLDPRFLDCTNMKINSHASFASDAVFVRGCISITSKSM